MIIGSDEEVSGIGGVALGAFPQISFPFHADFIVMKFHGLPFEGALYIGDPETRLGAENAMEDWSWWKCLQ